MFVKCVWSQKMDEEEFQEWLDNQAELDEMYNERNEDD